MFEAAPFIVLELTIAPPIDIGVGGRRCMPIVGGRVQGGLEGEVLPGGADWQTILPDGTLEIDARYAFRTASGVVVEVASTGVRSGSPEILAKLASGVRVDPSAYYFRTFIRLSTAAPELKTLNDRLWLARGERGPQGVRLEVFEVP